jgi:hypothetical protein
VLQYHHAVNGIGQGDLTAKLVGERAIRLGGETTANVAQSSAMPGSRRFTFNMKWL